MKPNTQAQILQRQLNAWRQRVLDERRHGDADGVEAARARCAAIETELAAGRKGAPSCCANEQRNWNGSCRNCGDPCL